MLRTYPFVDSERYLQAVYDRPALPLVYRQSELETLPVT